MARSFEFAVLRLSPDPARGESINIGVVVFLEGGVDVRIGEVLTRARVLCPEATPEVIGEGVNVLRRLGAASLPSAARHRSLQRFGLFTLGELGYFTVEDNQPQTYEGHVARLIRLFTATSRAARIRVRPTSRLNTEIRQELRREKVLAASGDAGAISTHLIVPDWPIPTRPSLKADLALRNSVMRVCQIVDLKLADEGPPPAPLFESVVTLDVAQHEANAEQTYFAYRATGPTARVDEALAIARLHASHLVDWNVGKERAAFLHDWVMAAKERSPSPPMFA